MLQGQLHMIVLASLWTMLSWVVFLLFSCFFKLQLLVSSKICFPRKLSKMMKKCSSFSSGFVLQLKLVHCNATLPMLGYTHIQFLYYKTLTKSKHKHGYTLIQTSTKIAVTLLTIYVHDYTCIRINYKTHPLLYLNIQSTYQYELLDFVNCYH